MNNSTLALNIAEGMNPTIEVPEERKAALWEKESSLIKQIEALENLERSSDWSSLKEEVFSGLKGNLQKRIFSEATKEKPDVSLLNRLSGQWEWSKRYADLTAFKDERRAELTSIRKMLYGKQE